MSFRKIKIELSHCWPIKVSLHVFHSNFEIESVKVINFK